jgi:hypothetical protein
MVLTVLDRQIFSRVSRVPHTETREKTRIYTSISSYVFMKWFLIKRNGNFTFFYINSGSRYQYTHSICKCGRGLSNLNDRIMTFPLFTDHAGDEHLCHVAFTS